MRTAVLRLAAVLLPLALIACGGKAASPTPALTPVPSGLLSPGVVPTSDQLCQLLTVDNWNAAGLTGAVAPTIDDDGPGTGSAYCTYSAKSGGTGGLELDVFVDQAVDGAQANFATIAQSLPPSGEPNISGIDEGQPHPVTADAAGHLVIRVPAAPGGLRGLSVQGEC